MSPVASVHFRPAASCCARSRPTVAEGDRAQSYGLDQMRALCARGLSSYRIACSPHAASYSSPLARQEKRRGGLSRFSTDARALICFSAARWGAQLNLCRRTSGTRELIVYRKRTGINGHQERHTAVDCAELLLRTRGPGIVTDYQTHAALKPNSLRMCLPWVADTPRPSLRCMSVGEHSSYHCACVPSVHFAQPL